MLSASHSPPKIVVMGPVKAQDTWLSVTISGTFCGTPSSRHTCRMCFISRGSVYSVFQVMSQGSKG